MKATLILRTAGGNEERWIIDPCMDGMEENGEVRVSWECTAGILPETRFTLTALSDVCPRDLRLCVDAAEVLNATPENLLLYDAGGCTNAFAQVVRAVDDAGQPRHIFSRDLCMVHALSLAEDKRTATDLALAFTTFQRFYTSFFLCGGMIEACWNLENKPIATGASLALESIAVECTTNGKPEASGLSFFERYASLLKARYVKRKLPPIPCGWSSWSCYYGAIDEKKIEKQGRLLAREFGARGARLVQIDDGWQREDSFGAYWTENLDRFPSGMVSLQKVLSSIGLDFGLWMAPGLVCDQSTRFPSLQSLMLINEEPDGSIVKSFGGNGQPDAAGHDGSVYPLDITREEVKSLVREMFARGKNEYGSVYFKIDFLINLLYRAGNGNTPVVYKRGYAVENYRALMSLIRETVGNEVFLLACGAPVGESAGIFDAIRVSPDITWGGANNPGHPGAWNILRMDAQNAVLRAPYHGKVFINDPDALLVRDYLTENASDGLALSEEEAKMWVCAVAMSGGHILLNEEIEKLSPAQRALCADIMPSLGLAARPVDFFELPQSSSSYIDLPDGGRLLAVYNWGEEETEKAFSFPDLGRCAVIDCFDKKILGVADGAWRVGVLPRHTCRAFLLRPLTGREGFLYSDDGFYLGANIVHGEGLSLTADRPCRAWVLANREEPVFTQSGLRFTRVPNEFSLPLYRTVLGG